MDVKKILNQIEQQEETLIFDEFHNEDALVLGNMLASKVKNSVKPLAIRVYIGDVIVFQYSMEGKEEEHYNWIRRKRNLMLKLGHSSMYGRLEWQFLQKHEELFANQELYGFGCGAFPIIVKGKGIIGTVALSGLPDPADHIIITQVLEELLNISSVELEVREEDLNR
ncbi:MAG: hypothetical protein HGA25_05380 [Clostridiales bacterium]|nr:hypothetical protein [Clostridiales bacterium]